ncbi:MAG: hypothetical protein BroJett021_28050 [Chloroflexota bacterium]|nr:MAG: hypothetical protein BroJett021_28050 [Chloroflexota bacterium]
MIASQMWMAGIVAEERARLERWQKAWDAYFGSFPPALKMKPGAVDDNVAVNYVRLIVDKGVSFLFGQPFQFELDSDSSKRTPAEQWLDECMRVNGGQLLWQKLAVNGGVCGHCFVKIVPSATPGGYPRLVNLSPEYVTVVCDPDDIDLVWRYIIQYPAMGKEGERLVVRQVIERDAGGRWTITDEVSVNNGSWETRQAIQWPWNWAPVVDMQNLPSPNEYYGVADVEEDVLRLNYAINFTLSNLQRIIRFHAHPRTWGQGFAANTLKMGVDETIVLPAGATLQNLEMQSDLTSSITYYERLKMALHETAHVPEVATGKLENAGALSGVALRILYQPLLDRTEQKRLTYGSLIVELFRRLLDMAGYGPDNLVRLTWPELLPSNRLETLQAAVLESQIGVSQDTTLRNLGYDPDIEREKREMDGGMLGEQLLTAFDRGV